MEKDQEKKWKITQLTQYFSRENLIVLILVGVLLFIIAFPTKKDQTKESNLTQSVLQADESETKTGETLNCVESGESYVEKLEQRLKTALSSISGVGEVRVMITLKASEELVVEKESPVNRSATSENDSQGGNRTVNTTDIGETVVYKKEGSNSTPYVIKSYYPEIEGVLIVAEGAGNGTVNRTMNEIAQALFGVEAHKVKVVKMEAKSAESKSYSG